MQSIFRNGIGRELLGEGVLVKSYALRINSVELDACVDVGHELPFQLAKPLFQDTMNPGPHLDSAGQLEVVDMNGHHQTYMFVAVDDFVPEEVVVVEHGADGACVDLQEADERQLEHERCVGETIHGSEAF